MASQPINLSDDQLDQLQAEFAEQGYVVLPNVIGQSDRMGLVEQIRSAIEPLMGPAEFEADVGYPGAPIDRSAPGGKTPRRLLHAYARSDEFKALATNAQVAEVLGSLLAGSVCLSQCHHNCIMTKHPGFSSATLWHQDVRYWSFEEPELISAWFALGAETQANGALWVIPGTHTLDLRPSDSMHLFLLPELSKIRHFIQRAEGGAKGRDAVFIAACYTRRAAMS